MAGLGGAHLSEFYAPMWVEGMVAGRGWIALALVVFATWRPARVMLGSDYPFDMGTPDGVSQVRGLSIAATDQKAILGGAALGLLGRSDAEAGARAFV